MQVSSCLMRSMSIVLVAIPFVFGCGHQPEPAASLPAAKSPARPIEKESAAEPAPVADESLSSDEYIRLGLPSPDREWSGEDMAAAEKVLASVAQGGYQRLPRSESVRSKDVFSRLTSDSNLDLFRNRSFPIEARFPELLKYMDAHRRVLLMYISGFTKSQVRDSEIVELMGAQLHLAALVFELTDEFLLTIDKNDPTYSTRMQGVERVKKGAANVVMGTLQMLTEQPTYRASELRKLVGHMQETYPVLISHLSSGSRTEALVKLEKMQDDPQMSELQPGLRELLEKLREVVPGGTE